MPLRVTVVTWGALPQVLLGAPTGMEGGELAAELRLQASVVQARLPPPP